MNANEEFWMKIEQRGDYIWDVSFSKEEYEINENVQSTSNKEELMKHIFKKIYDEIGSYHYLEEFEEFLKRIFKINQENKK